MTDLYADWGVLKAELRAIAEVTDEMAGQFGESESRYGKGYVAGARDTLFAVEARIIRKLKTKGVDE